MPGNFKREDLRIVKTHKALSDVLPKLLEKRSFGQITVNDICEEAQLSRTAFYTHFQDKYDYLKQWLKNMNLKLDYENFDYFELEKTFNKTIRRHTKVIKNILQDANNETLELINEFLVSILNVPKKDFCNGKPCHEYTVLTTFCAGGLFNLLLWQTNNNFPVDRQMVDENLFKILSLLLVDK